MAKTKPDVKAQAKKVVATNAMFKKAGSEALHQEKSRHAKHAIEKPTNALKGKKGFKSKHVAKHTPENPLAAEFAANIEYSRETIQEKVLARLDYVYSQLSSDLVDSYNIFQQREQFVAMVCDAFVDPLDEQELEWTSTDGKQSGKTMLGHRMKKCQKTIEAEEKEFVHQYDEWTRVQTELRDYASSIIGPDGLDNLLAGNFDPACYIDAEQREMMEEIEAEQKAFMEQLEKAGLEAVEAMTESQKKLDLKQKEHEDYFLAILRDEE